MWSITNVNEKGRPELPTTYFGLVFRVTLSKGTPIRQCSDSVLGRDVLLENSTIVISYSTREWRLSPTGLLVSVQYEKIKDYSHSNGMVS